MTMQSPEERPCPVCGKRDCALFMESTVDDKKYSKYTYASRKEPEFMNHRYVRCLCCQTVYAPVPPTSEFLAEAYTDAGYDSGEEAWCAAKTYARILKPFWKKFPLKNCAVDVGAGNGALLPAFKEAGFAEALGIEPSKHAINAAPVEIQPFLINGMFSRDMLAGKKVSFICSFQTLEHLRDPFDFMQTAYDLLEPGGAVAIIVHNYRSVVNRLLGRRSPIIDVEHLQIFCPAAIEALFARCGFKTHRIKAFCNAYPVKYWLRLSSLPAGMKSALNKALLKTGAGSINIPVNVGNILAIGIK